MANPFLSISLNGASEASAISNKCGNSPFECTNPFKLTCLDHFDTISVRCGRWRSCVGCSAWKQWTLKQRFTAGIDTPSVGKCAMFFTLTFPQARAPDEDQAHRAWRSLVGRLRYRRYLGPYGWVLQRQHNGTLHFHGIAQLPWFNDALAEWRELLLKSGFGKQNKLVVAERHHAGYCAKYISTRLAELAPLRRAYGFSADFPEAEAPRERRALAERYGIVPDDQCTWIASYLLNL
jgi:hypothetical protein